MSGLLDQAMSVYGANQWSFDQLAVPRKTIKSSEELENPITLETFMEEVCRRPDGMKGVASLFDVHLCVPEIGGLSRLVDRVLEGKYESLPFPLCPAKDLPKGTTISYVIHNKEDGTMNVYSRYCTSPLGSQPRTPLVYAQATRMRWRKDRVLGLSRKAFSH